MVLGQFETKLRNACQLAFISVFDQECTMNINLPWLMGLSPTVLFTFVATCLSICFLPLY